MRTRLKLKFTGRAALEDIWERELKRGQIFIPARRCLPADSKVTLVISVPDAPGPLELNGTVRLVREPEHCAANQKPGMGIEIEVERRERRAVESFIQGDWAGAALVIGQEDGPSNPAMEARPASAVPPRPAVQAAPGNVSGLGQRAVPGSVSGPEQRSVASGRPATPLARGQDTPVGSRGGSSSLRIQSSTGRPPAHAEGSIVAVRRQRTAPGASMSSSPQEMATGFVETHRTSNHFEVLGLARGASEDDIRRGYLRLVKQFHPDRYFGRLDDEAMRAMEEAYQLVTDAYEALTSGRANAPPGAAVRRPSAGAGRIRKP